jgi:hypothetical protein
MLCNTHIKNKKILTIILIRLIIKTLGEIKMFIGKLTIEDLNSTPAFNNNVSEFKLNNEKDGEYYIKVGQKGMGHL